MFLGSGANTADEAESATKLESKSAIETGLRQYFNDNADRPWAYNNLVNVARFTAVMHGLLSCVILAANIALEISDDKTFRSLKTITTKTVTGWVGINASHVMPVKDLGFNSLHPGQTMTISDKCNIPGDYASRSSSFNTRAFSFEVGELDIRWMMFGFFTLSFIFQAYGSWSMECYIRPLLEGNARRSHLVEYSFSASLMMMAMCAQVGVTDVHVLSNVFSNTWACMIFGLLSDVLSETEIEGVFSGIQIKVPMTTLQYHLPYKWIAHLAGWFTLMIAGSVMVSNIETFRTCFDGISIPDEIIAAIFFELVLFFLFGFVQVYTLISKPARGVLPRTLEGMPLYKSLKMSASVSSSSEIEATRITQYGKDKQNFISTQKKRIHVACRAEFCYLVLSLTAKATLGGFVYISAAMRKTE